MIAKYQADLTDIDSKSKKKLIQYENENLNLKDQLKILVDEKSKIENKYKSELESLRNVTRDLHERLGNKSVY